MFLLFNVDGTLICDGHRDEAASLEYFKANTKKFTMKQMKKWLSTRHLSKTKMGPRGKPEVLFVGVYAWGEVRVYMVFVVAGYG